MSPKEIALLLDTEGCIGAALNMRSGITAHITVGMTDPTFLKILFEKFGGNLSCRKAKPGRKPCWVWQVRGHKCVPVLFFKQETSVVAKELRLKRLQAMYTLLLIQTLNKPGNGSVPPNWKLDLREKFYFELRRLNQRGVEYVAP